MKIPGILVVAARVPLVIPELETLLIIRVINTLLTC